MVAFTLLLRLLRPFDLQDASALAPISPFFLQVLAFAPVNNSLNSMYIIYAHSTTQSPHLDEAHVLLLRGSHPVF